ncbi:MAG TPA: GMC family oxidoreductase [Steroidobacteraceae bacterium]
MSTDPIDVSRKWDVIVVGSGMGGATVAQALAHMGLEVLVLEKGRRVSVANGDEQGVTPEERIERGWWPLPVSEMRSDGTRASVFAPLGCAVGGSTIHYAAALERMAATDFQQTGSAVRKLPVWPVSYEEFLSYYEAAEKLYRVQLSPEAATQRMSEWDRALMERMRRNGLQPEPLHVAIRYDEQCEECIGRVCLRKCKADASSACLDDALRLGNCRLLQDCDVQSVEATATSVQGVRAVCAGKEILIHGRIVVLSAGAFRSPLILLRSVSPGWPAGLANQSDQVGRNLTCHTSDLFAVWAPHRYGRSGKQKKAISVRDFYQVEGERLGYVQSMGIEIGRGAIALHLKNVMRGHGVKNERLLSLLAKVPSHLGAALLGNAGLFAAMTEDDPDANNRVTIDPEQPDGARFSYTITPDLHRRADALRGKFATAIRPWRLARLSTSLAMNYGHPCGTCRFGEDPSSSVLDRDCRAHGLSNLFVVDASFMPRSGAINPSLTIAANALRVAPRIAAALG